ncbi:MAG: hypothetical protein ABI995_17245, partial [Acidobacteriota bacterium]
LSGAGSQPAAVSQTAWTAPPKHSPDSLSRLLETGIMRAPTKPFALCVDNTGYEASLIPGKVYRILPDLLAAKDDMVRLVDESGEYYLFHKIHFAFVDFPPAVKRRILELHAV